MPITLIPIFIKNLKWIVKNVIYLFLICLDYDLIYFLLVSNFFLFLTLLITFEKTKLIYKVVLIHLVTLRLLSSKIQLLKNVGRKVHKIKRRETNAIMGGLEGNSKQMTRLKIWPLVIITRFSRSLYTITAIDTLILFLSLLANWSITSHQQPSHSFSFFLLLCYSVPK